MEHGIECLDCGSTTEERFVHSPAIGSTVIAFCHSCDIYTAHEVTW